MAGKRQFRAQPLQVVCTDEMRAKIEQIAEGENISLAQVIREALEDGGLNVRYALYQTRTAKKKEA